MEEKVKYYINSIIEAKWWADKLYWIPTDIIWLDDFWLKLAKWLEPLVTKKEICYYDDAHFNTQYHFLPFDDMLHKTELMIFTHELHEDYLENISKINRNVLIVLDASFNNLIEKLRSEWLYKNLLIMDK